MTIFEQAEKCITSDIITRYFDVTGSKIEKCATGQELVTRCPFRVDKNIGSFRINLNTGLWRDFSTNANPDSGNFIQLVSLANNIDIKDAAQKIITDTGGIIPDEKEAPVKMPTKTSDLVFAPIDAIEKFKDHAGKKYFTDKYGELKKAYKYIKNGHVWLITARYEKDGEKNVIPFSYTGEKWIAKNPYKNRPLMGIDDIQPGKPIIIVEGEKCQRVESDNYTLLTWCGGTGQIKLSDFDILKEHDSNIYLWPDNDDAGKMAMNYVRAKVPNAIILNIPKDKPVKWDIFDAVNEGVSIDEFILSNAPAPPVDLKEQDIKWVCTVKEDKEQPFKFLGYDDDYDYFLPQSTRRVYKISNKTGSCQRRVLYNLAPREFWEMNFYKVSKNEADTIDLESAHIWLIEETQKAGNFDRTKIRGLGIWKDRNNIVFNNGNKPVDSNGKLIDEKAAQYHYISREENLELDHCKEATVEECNQLFELYKANEFVNIFDALKVMCWTLFAPFGGIVDWRPHIWINGKSSSGKSALIDKYVYPLLGQSRYRRGTSDSTTASIYRDAEGSLPFIMDEMEGNTQADRMRIQDVLRVIRNSSSNVSNTRTISDKNGGTIKQQIFSMFMLSSVNHVLEGETFENRFLLAELKSQTEEAKNKKIANCKRLMKQEVFKDFGIFRQRIFNRIDQITENIEIIRDCIAETDSIREADNLAPIFSVYYACLFDDCTLTDEKLKWYRTNIIEKCLEMEKKDIKETDQEKVFQAIFESALMVDETRESHTIGYMMSEIASDLVIDKTHNYYKALIKNGIGFKDIKDGDNKQLCLVLAKGHKMIKRIMKETEMQMHINYYQTLKRDSAILDCKKVRLGSTVRECMIFDWYQIKERFFDDV